MHRLESLDCSSVTSCVSLRVPVFVEQPERNVQHELLALLSLHLPVNCVASSTIITCVPSEN